MSKDREKPGVRNVVALGFVSLFTDISTEMPLAVLPAFILKSLGETRAVLGIIEGIAMFIDYGLRTVSGLVSDLFGSRKPLVLFGYSISSIAKPFLAISRTWTDVLAVRCVDRSGKGIRTSPRDVLISESVSKSELGRAFGIHRALDEAGAVLGPSLAFILLPLVGFRGVFALSVVPGMMAVLILLLLVKEAGPRRTRKVEMRLNLSRLGKGYLLFLITIGLFSIGAFSYSFILTRAMELGIAITSIPLIYALLNASYIMAAPLSGMLADRIGVAKVLCACFSLLGIASALCTVHGHQALALTIALMYGAYHGMFATMSRAMAASASPAEVRGTAYGLMYVTMAFGMATANSVLGWLYDAYGPSAAFVLPLVTSSCAAMISCIFMVMGMGGAFKRG